MGGAQGGAGRGARAGGGRSGLVFVKSGTSYAPRMVRLGVSDFDYTQVISGLDEGEEVALLAAVALQAQRNEMNDRMRSRMSVPGMNRGSSGSSSSGASARPGGR